MILVSAPFVNAVVPVICGDYYLDEGEECDDGNNESQDGCSSTCQEELLCDNPLILEFDELLTGEVVNEQYYQDYGITIVTNNYNPSHPDKAIIFNSSNPTGGDFDLGTPNEIYGGPGIGAGGISNNKALNNVLIIAENDIDADNDSLVDNPDDEAAGGEILFLFDERVFYFNKLTLLDMDLSGSEVYVDDEEGGIEFFFDVANTGDNSVQTIYLNSSEIIDEDYFVDLIRVGFSGSGALDRIVLCPFPCDDEDNDGVCDEDDECPESLPGEPVDEHGCDIFQFCSQFSCGPFCFQADWRNNEQLLFPHDCKVVVQLNNGIPQIPICVPTEFSEMCAN